MLAAERQPPQYPGRLPSPNNQGNIRFSGELDSREAPHSFSPSGNIATGRTRSASWTGFSWLPGRRHPIANEPAANSTRTTSAIAGVVGRGDQRRRVAAAAAAAAAATNSVTLSSAGPESRSASASVLFPDPQGSRSRRLRTIPAPLDEEETVDLPDVGRITRRQLRRLEAALAGDSTSHAAEASPRAQAQHGVNSDHSRRSPGGAQAPSRVWRGHHNHRADLIASSNANADVSFTWVSGRQSDRDTRAWASRSSSTPSGRDEFDNGRSNFAQFQSMRRGFQRGLARTNGDSLDASLSAADDRRNPAPPPSQEPRVRPSESIEHRATHYGNRAGTDGEHSTDSRWQIDDTAWRQLLANGDQTTPACHECSICYSSIEDDAVALPCSAHGCRSFFHGTCIKPWLQKNPSCPLCRSSLASLARRLPSPPRAHGFGEDESWMIFWMMALAGEVDAATRSRAETLLRADDRLARAQRAFARLDRHHGTDRVQPHLRRGRLVLPASVLMELMRQRGAISLSSASTEGGDMAYESENRSAAHSATASWPRLAATRSAPSLTPASGGSGGSGGSSSSGSSSTSGSSTSSSGSGRE